jgi:citrate lyase subunit alpha/citrate CoA-transferase
MRRAITLENRVQRKVSEDTLNKYNYRSFQTTEIGHPDIQRVAPKVHVTTGDNKVVESLRDVVKKTVHDGMTISFHHHLETGISFLTKLWRLF